MIRSIYKVSEKNCYPGKNGQCIHLCTVLTKDKEIKDVLLDSTKIVEINEKNKHSSSIHFKDPVNESSF